MCYASSCDPRCGACKPKRLVEARCPECGALNALSREEFLLAFDLPHKKNILEQKMIERGAVPQLVCASCGASTREAFAAQVTPRECKGNRVICGFPCGRSDDPPREGAMPCPTMVPLKRPKGRLPNGQ